MIALVLFGLFAITNADIVDVLIDIDKVDDDGDPLIYKKYSYNKCYTTLLNLASVKYIKTDEKITKVTYTGSAKCDSTFSIQTNLTYDVESEQLGYKTKIVAPLHVGFVNIADDFNCSHKNDMQRSYYGTGCFEKKYRYTVDKCPDNDQQECLVKYEYVADSNCKGDKIKVHKENVCDQCVASFWVQCGAKETMIFLLVALLFILF